MKGFYIAEEGHYAPLLLPQDLNGGNKASTVIRMGRFSHADIFIYIGVATRAAGIAIPIRLASNS